MRLTILLPMLASVVLGCGLLSAAETYDHRGPNQDGVFPARDYITDFSLGPKLILWKTLLPAEGQNTPIVVGDKVFLLCSNGLESDCPELFCLSIHDGKILWRKPVDNLDALPSDQQAEAKALRKHELMLNHKARDLFFRFKVLQSPDPGGGNGMVITDKAVYEKVKTEAKELGILCEEHLGTHLRRDGNYFKRFPFEYLGPHATNKERKADCDKLNKNDWFRYENWHYPEHLYTGRTFPSPVSDGKHVWVLTQDGTAACFDLDGNRKWLVDAMAVKDGNSSLVTASPALVGDIVVVYHCMTAVALDKNTGEVKWRHETGIPGTYSEAGTPVHLVVDGMDYLYLGSSQILRLGDGKMVGRLKPPDGFKGGYREYLGAHFDSIGRGNRLWVVNNTNGGGGSRPTLFHFVLSRKGEEIVGELMWYEQIEQPCVVMDGDRLHQVGLRGWQVLDPATAKEVKKGRGIRETGSRCFAMTDHHLIAMASTSFGQDRGKGRLDPEEARAMKPAGTLLVLDKETMQEVGRLEIPMEPPEGEVLKRRIARVALPIWQTHGGNWGTSSPMAWGNRILVRNNDAVYCVGMPGTQYKAP